MKEINSVIDFYELIEGTKVVTDNFSRAQLITKKLTGLSEKSIINFEKYLRKELIHICHYNIALLFELSYPSPVFTKNGKPIELPGEPYLSTDGFIYFRCGIILLGKEAVNQLLEDPNNIIMLNKSSAEIDAEGLLYCATDALKNKRSTINLDDSLDRSEHYDWGSYSILGEKIKWYAPEEEYPELVKYYNYKRTTMELPDSK